MVAETRSSLECLPRMGLGLGSNLDADALPDPFRMHDADPSLFDYVEYSAPLALEAAARDAARFAALWAGRARLPALFHPVHLNLYGPELEAAAALAALDAHVRAVDSPWVSNDVAWWHAGGHAFPGHRYVPPPLSRAGLADCVAHARHVQEALSVPLLLENPAVVARRGTLHVLEFFAELHARTGCALLLDLGHLLSHQLACGLAPDAGLDDFPLDAVLEIHVAGGVVTERGARRFYFDDHPQPLREEVLELLAAIAPRCPRLRALTFEGDGQPDPIVAATLRRLRAHAPARGPGGGAAAASPPRGEHRGGGAPDSSAPWALFTETCTGCGEAGADPEDPEGLRVEIDFRLAVLAEIVDRDWPWTRRLAAPSRAALLAFSASAELRAHYAAGAHADLAECFGAWCVARLADAADPAVRRVLEFERSARSLAAEAERRAPPPAGNVALGEGVGLGQHDHDLSELLYAGQALQRHLDGRAQASGVWEPSGLAALRQVALRAPAVRWPFAVRRRARRLEVLPLPPGLARTLAACARGGAWTALATLPGVGSASLRWALAAGWIRRGEPTRPDPQ
jgi:uncharacterized protein (UPF0276 family)